MLRHLPNIRAGGGGGLRSREVAWPQIVASFHAVASLRDHVSPLGEAPLSRRAAFLRSRSVPSHINRQSMSLHFSRDIAPAHTYIDWSHLSDARLPVHISQHRPSGAGHACARDGACCESSRRLPHGVLLLARSTGAAAESGCMPLCCPSGSARPARPGHASSRLRARPRAGRKLGGCGALSSGTDSC